MKQLTGQKFAAICRKHGLPKFETTGFNFNSYSQEISYSSGCNQALKDEVELFVSMARALMTEGFDVYYGQQSYSKSPIFRMNLFGNVFKYENDESFRSAFEEYIIADNDRIEEESQRKIQREQERKRIWNEKLRIAREINPDVRIDILETLDENHHICYTKMNTPNGFVYIQFAAERKAYWADESLKWYLKLQPLQFVSGRFDGGSTNVDNCETVEDGLIDYIATWHVYLSE